MTPGAEIQNFVGRWPRMCTLLRQVGTALIVSTIWLASVEAADLLSKRNTSIPPSVTGNGDSVALQLTKDGRFVLFSSAASDLATNQFNYSCLNLFLHDRQIGTTLLISQTTNGRAGDRRSIFGSCSTNGRFVAFQSAATGLVPNDLNGVEDVFLRDTVGGTTHLISRSTSGGSASGPSYDAAISEDGRYVAFISDATNLTSWDTNGIPDVFIRDTVSNLTTCASPGAVWVGSSNVYVDSPVLSPDGRFVVFFSTARGMIPGVSNISRGEIYLRDLQSETTTWISRNALSLVRSNVQFATAVPVPSHPVISDDGRYAAFKCGWTNGLGGFPNGTAPVSVVFRHDTWTDSTAVVNTNGFPPNPFSDDVYGPVMTDDGRFVAFVTRERNGTVTNSGIWMWDADTGTNIPISVDLSGSMATNGISHTPRISADGAAIAFLSAATNLVTNTVSPGYHVYAREIASGTMQLVDVGTNGVSNYDQEDTLPVASADGTLIAFDSLNDALTPGDANHASDVFVYNFPANQVQAISVRDDSLVSSSGNKLSAVGGLAMTPSGTKVTFSSYASDLVTNDFNHERDVFLADLAGGTNQLISAGLDGNAALGGASHTPSISLDGRYVHYVSAATNLINNDTNGAADIFQFDRQSGTNRQVNVATNGLPLGVKDAGAPVASSDGRYMTFQIGIQYPSANPSVYWRDMDSNKTILLSLASGVTVPPSISDDGQRVAFTDSAGKLYVWDAAVQANIWTNNVSVSAGAISPAGNAVAYRTGNQLFIHSFDQTTNLPLGASLVAIKGSSQWSGDGRYFAFVSGSSLVPSDDNNTNDVYLYDSQSQSFTLVSMNHLASASGNGPSDWPCFSGDGRCLVYRSFASDIVSTNASTPMLIVFDRLTGQNTLAAGTAKAGLSSWTSRPILSTNGQVLAFQSSAPGIDPSDLNESQDTFAQQLALVSLMDTDDDGIPDWWMNQYFTHPTGEAGDLSRAQDDGDGDGMSNLEEFLTGTIPTELNSVFKLNLNPVSAVGTNVVLSWTALPGKSYRVESTEDLAEALWLPCVGNPVVAGKTGYLNWGTVGTNRYFRVIVEY
jgi:hypothetical protein